MRERTAEDVFGPIVSLYLWEKSSPISGKRMKRLAASKQSTDSPRS
jgi:hypothetical protein